MKKAILISLASTTLLLSSPFFANGAEILNIGASESNLNASRATETVVPVGPTTMLRNITYHGSDSTAIGDPLGNNPVTLKDDQGPPLTQRLSYDPNCQQDACARAFKRWNSSGSWTQDRAKGLSLGWGKSS
jgi:hypothetical protein